ncbi:MULTISPECIES: hypothetical protein [unclassified Streptomyces]|uniref:hypothetical protein n=1 Tax=unclassified Streptomyces TaxID=2593676 RepID=UPI002250BB7D|nr:MULTISPECIES: hypothetical protein [unclassified Streptomyces]MCX5048933.1 hypothetical protein [Streptomyces sp. NBC_00474]MCX5246774.1 hypothetical protein [Streptomyces sp. NBC_00201]MCX5287432.1 hypothetical protein [Streptomyces sp. NBC_00183]
MRAVPAPKVWVTGLTVGAIAAVVVLAEQADKGAKPRAVAARPSASASAGAHPKPTRSRAPATVPDGSGTGRRIVYSLGQKTVWLVDASDAPRRAFAVWPGTVSPDPGTYTVGTRTEGPITGSDGVKIEHIVYFTVRSGSNIAFSNAVDGTSPPPASGTPTGGIRMRAADGSAVWTFGTAATKVVVVG